MIGWVTRHLLPHLSGFPHLHVNRPIIKLSQIRINSKHFIFITVIILDRKYNSPRKGQSSPTQTKIRDSFAYNESRDNSYPQFPPVSARNAWEYGLPFGEDTQRKKETPAFLESRSATISSIKYS